MRGLCPGYPYRGGFSLDEVGVLVSEILPMVVHEGVVDPQFTLKVVKPSGVGVEPASCYCLSGTIPAGYVPGETVVVFVTYKLSSGPRSERVDLFMVEDNRMYEVLNAVIGNFVHVKDYIKGM